jgi:hypothetical protein
MAMRDDQTGWNRTCGTDACARLSQPPGAHLIELSR